MQKFIRARTDSYLLLLTCPDNLLDEFNSGSFATTLFKKTALPEAKSLRKRTWSGEINDSLQPPDFIYLSLETKMVLEFPGQFLINFFNPSSLL